MVNVVGVSFDNSNKIFYFLPNKYNLKKNITVIVSTVNGLQFGKVVVPSVEINESNFSTELKKVVRIASKEDYNAYMKNKKDAAIALKYCKNVIEEKKMNMTLVDANYTFDRNQLVFRFLSDSRVDFRELAKDLASKFKIRIELRQIGARDRAKEIGGCGQCGRTLCCAKFLNDLDSVSINMAKNQNIALNPNKINGLCGRLLCCLKYEDQCYKDCKGCMPIVGQTVKIAEGSGRVVSVDLLNMKYKVDIPSVGIVEVSKNNGSN